MGFLGAIRLTGCQNFGCFILMLNHKNFLHNSLQRSDANGLLNKDYCGILVPSDFIGIKINHLKLI